LFDPSTAALARGSLASAPRWIDQLRLSATQDVAWALATSPAFLFNR